MLHIIEEAYPEAGHRLRLRFADGRVGRVDLSDLVARGGVFARLRDGGEFARVRVAGGGRWLEWPGDIDLCADALYQSTQPQSN
jgi:hypothetical protein